MMRVAAAIVAALAMGGLALAQTDAAPAQTQETPAPPPSSAAPPAAAQQPPPPPADDTRYTFHRIRDGFVRLDSRTGQVAQCGWSAAGWSCTAAPDERAALEAEIARVQAENAALKKELLARGIELPGGVRPEPPAAKAPDARPDAKLPSEAEIDRAFNFMKGVWRRLIEMMAELQRDMQRKS